MRDYLHRLDELKRELADGGYRVTEQEYILQIMAGTQEEFGDYISIQTGNSTLDDLDRSVLCDQLIKQDSYRQTSKTNHDSKVFMLGTSRPRSRGTLEIETSSSGRQVTNKNWKR